MSDRNTAKRIAEKHGMSYQAALNLFRKLRPDVYLLPDADKRSFKDRIDELVITYLANHPKDP